MLPSAAISAQATSTTPSKLRLVESSSGNRVVGFDLESRPSAFWYDGRTTAEITAVAWKWTDEPEVRTLLLQRDGRWLRDDGRSVSLVKGLSLFAGELGRARLIFGHNVRKFDLPLFQAALLRAQLPPLGSMLTTDTLRDFPRRQDMSASLENLASLYGLGSGKKHMAIMEWERANRLGPEGLEATRERVVSDVLLQEQLRDKLLDLGLLRGPQRWRP